MTESPSGLAKSLRTNRELFDSFVAYVQKVSDKVTIGKLFDNAKKSHENLDYDAFRRLVQRLKNGETHPTPRTIEVFARGAGKTPDQFVEDFLRNRSVPTPRW